MATKLTKFNFLHPRHSWRHNVEHWYFCLWCRLRKENKLGSSAWYQEWTYPDGTVRDNKLSGEPVPRCEGPYRVRELFLRAVADGTVLVRPFGDDDGAVEVEPLPDLETDWDLVLAVECGFAERDELIVLDGPPDGPQVPRLTDLGKRWLTLAAEVPVGAGRR